MLLRSLSLCVQGNSRIWMRLGGPTPEDVAMLERALEIAKQVPESRARWGWASRSAVVVMVLLTLSDVLRYRDACRARSHLEDLLAVYIPDLDAHTGSFVLRAAGSLDADAGHWAARRAAAHRLTGTGHPRGLPAEPVQESGGAGPDVLEKG